MYVESAAANLTDPTAYKNAVTNSAEPAYYNTSTVH